jgi:hypothetical protein
MSFLKNFSRLIQTYRTPHARPTCQLIREWMWWSGRPIELQFRERTTTCTSPAGRPWHRGQPPPRARPPGRWGDHQLLAAGVLEEGGGAPSHLPLL